MSVVAWGVSACRASVNATAKVNGSEAQVDEDHKWEVPEAPTPAEEAPPTTAPKPAPRVASAVAATPTPSSGVAFLGVAHDLSLASAAPRAPTCRCLAVAYGPPNDAKFAWQAGAPAGDGDTIAIAITTDGVACAGGLPAARASIAAVEREGTDIVLVVENVGVGRPIMRGALAPWPGPNGAIVVRKRHDTAYPAADGAGSCRITIK